MAKQAMSGHFNTILKHVTTRLWDTLSNREREIVASDVDGETEIAKWFRNTALSEAKEKFESPTYWLNAPDSFKYPYRQDSPAYGE